MKSFIFLTVILQNPLAQSTSIPAILNILDNYVIPIGVGLVAISLLIAGFRILKGRRIRKKTGSSTYLNNADVLLLYVMIGAAVILGALMQYYYFGPWIIGYFGVVPYMLYLIFFIVLCAIGGPRVIEKEKQKIYSHP